MTSHFSQVTVHHILLMAPVFRREAKMEDYDTFCRLIQTSKYIDMNGWMMVEPSDMPACNSPSGYDPFKHPAV